jgi:hypothetical protein
LHAIGGDNRPLDVAARLYVSSYATSGWAVSFQCTLPSHCQVSIYSLLTHFYIISVRAK